MPEEIDVPTTVTVSANAAAPVLALRSGDPARMLPLMTAVLPPADGVPVPVEDGEVRDFSPPHPARDNAVIMTARAETNLCMLNSCASALRRRHDCNGNATSAVYVTLSGESVCGRPMNALAEAVQNIVAQITFGERQGASITCEIMVSS